MGGAESEADRTPYAFVPALASPVAPRVRASCKSQQAAAVRLVANADGIKNGILGRFIELVQIMADRP